MRNKAFVLLFGVIVATSATNAAQSLLPTGPDRGDVARLLDGVDAMGVPGTVGQIALWGDDATAVVVGKDGGIRVPIIAASRLGTGRIIACAHDFASGSGSAQLDTGTFILNACNWLCGEQPGVRPLRIGLLKCDLVDFLNRQGIEVFTLSGGDDLEAQLRQAEVGAVLCNKSDLSLRELSAIESYIRRGGGFLCCACPWGWAQTHKSKVDAIPFNRLLERAGLAFTEGTADETRENGFVADSLPGDAFNATHALEILAEVESGARKARDPLVVQAGATLRNAADAVGMDDQILRPRLVKLLREREPNLAPTPEAPLGLNRPLDRALLALQVADFDSIAPEKTKPHPAAAAFPGAVSDDAPRVTRMIKLNATPLGWRSTGLYAPPGEVITIATNGIEHGALIQAGLRIRIGCHRDELWKLDLWKRVPGITRSWAIDSDELKVANALGGPMYIEVPHALAHDPMSISIAGGVEAPLYILGETTIAQWRSDIRNRPGPWAELVSDRVSLSVPSTVARAIDDPQALMEHWVKVLDADADLAGIPHDRNRPERFVADVQISAGYMHSGYPIMTHLDASEFMTDLVKLREHGWGPYHELGHNHQQGDWTFGGTTEVTCNLFSLYVIDTLYGVPPRESDRVLDAKSFEKMRQHLETDGKWERWKRDPFLALQMYALLQREFGWDAYKQVFAEYRGLNKEQRPKNDDEKRDQWMVRFSRTVGRNLGPYFEAWGVPTSAAARDSIKDLPAWLPEEMQERASPRALDR